MSELCIRSIRESINSDIVATVFGSSVEGKSLFSHHTNINDQDWLGFSATLAEAKVPIINGGYQGTMSLIAKQIRDDGGDCFGVVSSSFDDECSDHLFTNLYTVENAFDRLKTLILVGDMYIFLPGGIGSVVEIVCALWHIDRGFMEGKPLYFLGGYWNDLIGSIIEKQLMFKDSTTASNIHQFSDIASFKDELNFFIKSNRGQAIAS